MTSFTVIGSCRVHGPLRDRPGYQKSVVGYTHTAKEAIQRVRFVRGEVKISDHVAPFVFSRDSAPSVTDAQSLEDSDVVLVEICSAKEMQLDGYWLNLNYVAARKAFSMVTGQRTQSLTDDLMTLSAMVRRLMVVTHVDLAGLSDRAQFCREVRAACDALGIPVFSPADHVGPGDMLDVNHYKPGAIKRIGDRLMEFMQCKPET